MKLKIHKLYFSNKWTFLIPVIQILSNILTIVLQYNYGSNWTITLSYIISSVNTSNTIC